MPDTMTIRVNVDPNNQTVSRFTVADKGQVSIHNDASVAVDLVFAGDTPLCVSGAPMAAIPLPAGANRQFKVCDGQMGKSFDFTATVSGAGPGDASILIEGITGPVTGGEILVPDRDPIIIFEKSAFWGVAGLVIGMVAGYVLARAMASRSRG